MSNQKTYAMQPTRFRTRQVFFLCSTLGRSGQGLIGIIGVCLDYALEPREMVARPLALAIRAEAATVSRKGAAYILGSQGGFSAVIHAVLSGKIRPIRGETGVGLGRYRYLRSSLLDLLDQDGRKISVVTAKKMIGCSSGTVARAIEIGLLKATGSSENSKRKSLGILFKDVMALKAIFCGASELALLNGMNKVSVGEFLEKNGVVPVIAADYSQQISPLWFRADVSPIGEGDELLASRRRPRLQGHGLQLGSVVTNIGHLVRDDQMVLGVDRGLDVVAHDPGSLAARRHGPCIGIGQ
jgi:hypothetical protein